MQSMFWIFIFRCLCVTIQSWLKVILYIILREFEVIFSIIRSWILACGLLLRSRGISDCSCYIAVSLPPLHSDLCHCVPAATYLFYFLLLVLVYKCFCFVYIFLLLVLLAVCNRLLMVYHYRWPQFIS
jgi:hypothetical protein